MGRRLCLCAGLVASLSLSAVILGPDPSRATTPELERAYPEEALEILPQAILDDIPETMSRFLRLEDYQRLADACADLDPAETFACLTSEAGLNRLARYYLHSVLVAVLDQMDAELARRLSRDALELIAERCLKAIDDWTDCVFADGLDAERCEGSAESLASCISEDDAVNAAYATSQSAKKVAWGDPDSYVALRGLLALYTLDVVREVRKGCPQTEGEALGACLATHPITGAAFEAFGEAAAAVVAESVEELAAAGHTLDAEAQADFAERLKILFLTIPMRAITAIANTCEKEHPGLETLTDPAQIDLLFACLESRADLNAISNPAYIGVEKLRAWLGIGRAKVESALERKEAEAQARAFHLVLLVLLAIALLGALAIALLPLRLRRQHPDAVGLWRGSLVAAGVFIGVIAVLGGALLVMRTVQGAVSTSSTSPKIRVADAAFSVLESDDYVDGFSELSKLHLDFIKAPLRLLAADSADLEGEEEAVAVAAIIGEHWGQLLQQPEIKRLAKNIQNLTAQSQAYISVIGTLRSFDWALGYVPIALALLAVLLYLLPMRETLVNIALSPARAASGGEAGTKAALAEVLAELKVVAPYLLIVVLLLPIAGLFIALAVEPLMEMVINVALLQVFHLIGSEPSAFAIHLSLLGAVILLALIIAVYILAIAFYIGTARKVLRARFRDGRALADFKAFWLQGTLCLGGLLLAPALFAQLARVLQNALIGDFEGPMTDGQLWIAPVVSVLGFLILFWALRGLKAFALLRRDPTRAPKTPAAAH